MLYAFFFLESSGKMERGKAETMRINRADSRVHIVYKPNSTGIEKVIISRNYLKNNNLSKQLAKMKTGDCLALEKTSFQSGVSVLYLYIKEITRTDLKKVHLIIDN